MHRAVFIDALGTLLWMEAPWEWVDPELVAGLAPESVRAAFLVEMAYYRDHTHQGEDEASLAELRGRCAALLSRELGREVPVEAMLAAFRFHPFDDAEPALRGLHERGLKLVCVSNWDCSLPGVLEASGLRALLDGVVHSAGVGVKKPDPRIFAPALELAACAPEEALHVGDSAEDLEAARAAGIEALLIDRSGADDAAGGGEIASLRQIGEHLRS